MKGIIIFYLVTAVYVFRGSAESTCSIVCPFDEWSHITCRQRAGGVNIDDCRDDEQIEILFHMQDSYTTLLSADFFRDTNFGSYVQYFEATNNTWTQIEKETFKKFSETYKMTLSGNNIEMIKDGALLKLDRMGVLHLSHNLLNKITSRSLLTSETLDSKLRFINLSHNRISRVASDAFSKMPDLRSLHLQNNKISELSDGIFSNLKNLDILNLSNNRISSLNMTLMNLKNLRSLDVSNNKLQMLNGFEFNTLFWLSYLNLSNNVIESVNPDCFSKVGHLKSVDLSNNRIKSTIESVMFINNVYLLQVFLQNNSITQVQDNSFKHNNLMEFNFQNNNLSTAITEFTFAGLKQVTALDLSKQSITSLNNHSFSDMVTLEYLNVSNNKIKTVEMLAFEKTTILKVLDLSQNNLKTIDFFTDSLSNLTKLYLNYNNLDLLKSYMFKNLIELQVLEISYNNIMTIEAFALPLNKLQYLNISHNNLAGPIAKNVFSPAKYIRYLDLSGHNLSKIHESAFIDMPNLAWLKISKNIIENVSPVNFINLRNMYSLDLSENKLGALKVNTDLTKLKSLNLGHNKLIDLPIINATGLTYLDLSFNNISNLMNSQLENMKNVRTLHLGNNMIKTFNNNYTNSFTELESLDLSSNLLSRMKASYFSKLISLDLHNNSLKYVHSSDIKTLLKLQVFDISMNNIGVISPGIFKELKNLKRLNVSSNSISNLRYGCFRGLDSLESLDLSRNNLTIIELELFHECSELQKLIIDYNHLKELDMDKLINIVPKINHVSLGGNLVDCKEIVRNFKNFNRTIKVSLIDKIYHEDNVHGIKCGDTVQNVTSNELKDVPPSSGNSVVLPENNSAAGFGDTVTAPQLQPSELHNDEANLFFFNQLDAIAEERKHNILRQYCNNILFEPINDDNQIFGKYVSSVLKSLSSARNEKLRRIIQKAIVEIQDQEEGILCPTH